MRKPNYSQLAFITLLFVVFTAGYFLGNSQKKSQLTVSVSKEITAAPQETEYQYPVSVKTDTPHFPVSINHASKEELSALPGIGDVLAQRILDFRAAHGYFRSVEELLNVEGIGKKRLEEILDLIVIGG